MMTPARLPLLMQPTALLAAKPATPAPASAHPNEKEARHAR